MQGLSTFVCACNDGVSPVTLNPLAEAQASISRAARILPYPVPLLSHRIPFNEPRLDLGGCVVIGTGAGGLEKDGDVVGLTGSFVQRSAERTTVDFGA
jgi:hypothetical protein